MSSLVRRHLLLLPLAAMLFACASAPPQATVQVFTAPTQWPVGTTYRQEHLLSQAAQPRQPELEAVADALLAQAGLRRDDAAPRLAFQVTASQDQWVSAPYWSGSSVGVGVASGGRGGGVGIGLGFPIGGGGSVQTLQRVDVVVRDLASGQVVYQSRASGGSGVSPVALLQAAMSGFPNAPPGTRQVPLANPAGR
jgi:hypothetical protein